MQADCRIDHYQTPGQVCVTVFAKQVDKSRSTVVIEEEKVGPDSTNSWFDPNRRPKISLDLFLPNSKRFTRTLDLYGRVNREKSNFVIMGTKVSLCVCETLSILSLMLGRDQSPEG